MKERKKGIKEGGLLAIRNLSLDSALPKGQQDAVGVCPVPTQVLSLHIKS